MSNEISIKVENLWKRYGLPLAPILRQAKQRLRRQPYDRDADGPWSLRDLNLEVRRGETIGIIGRNGAGKSTLLKVLAGVTPPTYGKVQVRGSVFPMIELNAGLHPELSGRENVYLLGAIMGMTRPYVNNLMPEIEGFCELGEWFDRPVRKYSSGMLSRLGFSVAMKVDADILLVDEVLAVGDLAFQQKCYNQIAQFRADSDKTIILVSHSVRMIARLCDTVYIFERGQCIRSGDAEEVVNYYMRYSEEDQLHGTQYARPAIEFASDFNVDRLLLLDEGGETVTSVKTGQNIVVHLEISTTRRFVKPIIGISITSFDLLKITGLDSWNVGDYVLEGKNVVECRIENLNLLPGNYFFNVGVTSYEDGSRIYVGRNLLKFSVIPDNEKFPTLQHTGFVAFQAAWQFLPEP